MKTFLLHGDDIQKSYLRLNIFINEARKRGWEVIFLDETPQTVKENISSTSLFAKERFLIHRTLNKVTVKELNWIKKNSDKYQGNLVFYSEKIVGKTLISKLPKGTKVEEYKLPVLIWKFLDSFYPQNSLNAIKLYKNVLKDNSVEFIFGLLARQIRDLYWVKKDPSSLGYPSWRVGKLKFQAAKYNLYLLEEMIDRLADADVKSKTGKDSLISLLDFLIIEKLE